MKRDYFNNLKTSIDKALDGYLPSEKEEPKTIHKAMRYSVFSGGKRLRPILVVEASMACGGKLKDAVRVGCAVELVHTYSLIHDDLPSMDNDDYRRGKPACHKAFGEANAILAGDGLLTLAFNVITKDVNPKIASKAVRELSDAIGTKGMVGGQVIDLEFQRKRKRMDKKKLDYVNRLKTARLFETCTKLGAIVADASPRHIRAMSKYGEALGMAFQIVDDMIDREGYAKLFGKARARQDAKILIEKAKASLSIFGPKAERLKRIADHLLERES